MAAPPLEVAVPVRGKGLVHCLGRERHLQIGLARSGRVLLTSLQQPVRWTRLEVTNTLSAYTTAAARKRVRRVVRQTYAGVLLFGFDVVLVVLAPGNEVTAIAWGKHDWHILRFDGVDPTLEAHHALVLSHAHAHAHAGQHVRRRDSRNKKGGDLKHDELGLVSLQLAP